MSQKQNILIIKIGATGDVVRTSTLLHLYAQQQVYWVTAQHNMAVLPQQHSALVQILSLQQAQQGQLPQLIFDLVISLDDDLPCAQLASQVKSKRIFGAFVDNGSVIYSPDSNEWFDMGLSSRHGKQKADELKWKNTKTYQEILFSMLGYTFTHEHVYLIPEEVKHQPKPKTIGIENRAGARWPTKLWDKFDDLEKEITKMGYKVVYFSDKDNIVDYFHDISKVSAMVCGDTLGMHIALALNIPTVGIFTCTSAAEIFDYGCMHKVVSPHLQQAFYKTEYIPEAVQSIGVQEILQPLLAMV